MAAEIEVGLYNQDNERIATIEQMFLRRQQGARLFLTERWMIKATKYDEDNPQIKLKLEENLEKAKREKLSIATVEHFEGTLKIRDDRGRLDRIKKESVYIEKMLDFSDNKEWRKWKCSEHREQIVNWMMDNDYDSQALHICMEQFEIAGNMGIKDAQAFMGKSGNLYIPLYFFDINTNNYPTQELLDIAEGIKKLLADLAS